MGVEKEHPPKRFVAYCMIRMQCEDESQVARREFVCLPFVDLQNVPRDQLSEEIHRSFTVHPETSLESDASVEM